MRLLWISLVFVLFIIKNNAIPSNVYSIVHATPNTQPSGVSTELFSALYHTLSPWLGVNATPIIPGIKEIKIAKMNIKNFLIKNCHYKNYCC